jgi:putative intracellular protease/amidase
MVLSNPAVSTTTGRPVGFWWSELTHPWLAFTERGYEGEACARLSSREGARLVIGDICGDQIGEVAQSITHAGGDAIGVSR